MTSGGLSLQFTTGELVVLIESIMPDLSQIGAIIRSRTEGLRPGQNTGTFTSSTTPTDGEVSLLAELAAGEIADTLGENIPDEFLPRARGAAALYAAALVEGGAKEPRTALMKLWTDIADNRVKAIAEGMAEVGAGGQEGPSDDQLMPAYAFPAACPLPEVF